MTDYTVPPLVREAEAKYAAASRQLSDEGVASPSLAAIIGGMDAMQEARCAPRFLRTTRLDEAGDLSASGALRDLRLPAAVLQDERQRIGV